MRTSAQEEAAEGVKCSLMGLRLVYSPGTPLHHIPLLLGGQARTKMAEPGQGREIGRNQKRLIWAQGTNPAV